MTVQEFIQKNPEFKKYKCGYVLKSNGERVNYRTIKEDMLHINLKYYIVDTITDKVCLSGAIYNNYAQETEVEFIKNIELSKEELKQIKTEYLELKSENDKLYADSDNIYTNGWQDAYHKLNNYRKQLLNTVFIDKVPSWLKK